MCLLKHILSKVRRRENANGGRWIRLFFAQKNGNFLQSDKTFKDTSAQKIIAAVIDKMSSIIFLTALLSIRVYSRKWIKRCKISKQIEIGIQSKDWSTTQENVKPIDEKSKDEEVIENIIRLARIRLIFLTRKFLTDLKVTDKLTISPRITIEITRLSL